MIFTRNNILLSLFVLGCLSCHDAHFSNYNGLLNSTAPQICLQCHKQEGLDLLKIHHNIPVKESDCLKCHDPHLSENQGLFRNYSHAPFVEKACDKCHE